MHIQRFFVAVVILLMNTLSLAQTGANQSDATPSAAPAATAPMLGLNFAATEEDSSSMLPQIPSILGGSGISLTPITEQERSNYLRAGLNVGATYDDNATLVSTGAIGNGSISIFPNIGVEHTSSITHWDLDYAAGFTANQRLSNRNQGSHDLKFDSQFRLSPHVTLRLNEDFALTTGFFDSGNGATIGAGGPNASVITPLSTQRSSLTNAEADYHFALQDVAGVSGAFYNLHYSNVSQGALFTDTKTSTGTAFWLHQLGRNWIGASYRFQHLAFDPGNSTTDVNSLFAVDTFSFAKVFTLSGFAGAEHSVNHGVVQGSGETSSLSQTAPLFGVDAAWNGQRTGAAIGFSRQVSDGGGVLGAVRMQEVHGAIRHELFRGWGLGILGRYGNNKSLTTPAGSNPTSMDTFSAGMSVQHNLRKNLRLDFGYAHEFQDQAGLLDPAFLGAAHRNRVYLTIGYEWGKPLGR